MTGFCDSEGIDSTTHGFYRWNETEGGRTNSLNCVYGPVDENPSGKAARGCIRHRTWETYSIDQCISENTDRLRRIRDVRTQFLDNGGHNFYVLCSQKIAKALVLSRIHYYAHPWIG